MTPSVNTPTAPGRRPRVAIAHDWLVGLRGGEWVLDRIIRVVAGRAEIAGLWTMFDDGRPLTPAIDAIGGERRHVSWVGRLPGGSTRWRRWLLPLYPAAVAALSRDLAREHARSPIDLVVSTSSAAIKGLRPPLAGLGAGPGAGDGRRVPHLCYTHSPARYIWGQRGAYARTSPLRAVGLGLALKPYRRWDRATAANVSTFIANSTHIRAEIGRAYGRDAEVIAPPVRTEFFTPGPAGFDRAGGAPWLVVAALEPYKRVDVAIDAANRARRPLVVVGDGSQRRRLARHAGPTVRFVGRVSDDELLGHYRAAGVLLFPQIEDFGIAAVEAQACGLPVVALRGGGALDIVREGVTGAFFAEPTAEALLAAIERCPKPSSACRDNALRFAESRFDDAIGAMIDLALSGALSGASRDVSGVGTRETPDRA